MYLRCYFKPILLLIIIWVLLPEKIFSQTFGGFPPSFKWQMIDTDEVRVIFPKGLEGQAQRVVNTVKYLEANNRVSIGNKKHKINITLQNQTVISNGYVALAPFKSEFFTNPLQESNTLGSIPWLDLLAIHEYRHVLQFTNGRRGASLVANVFFGQNGWAFANGLAVPNWFWEGDAVVTETALSEQGRGRLPSFFNPFRSLGLSGTIYSYMKVRNGSFRDYVPNHYNLGYLMCVYGREMYGNEFWKGVFGDATSYRYVVYPFSRAIYNRTGKQDNSARFYKNTINSFHQKWKQELDTLKQTKAESVKTLPKRNTVTHYEYPYFINNEEIIVLKSSYKQIPYFTKFDKEGNETKLKTQGYSTDNYYDYKNGKIVWSELRFDARWGNFNYSILKIFDLQSEKTATLNTKTKYFSPALSQEATQIVAVEQTTNQQYSLHIIDAANGNLISILPNPDNLFYTYPKFSADNISIISSVRNKVGEMALISQNINSGEIQILVPFSNNIMGINFPTDSTIYFEASFSGIDNIFAVKPNNQQSYQITSRAIGNYQPALSPDGEKLIFSQFSKMGNKLYTVNMDNVDFSLFNIINISQQTKFDLVAMKAEGGSILKKVSNDSLPIKKYLQFRNLINYHSWIPEFLQPNYGITFYSNNILNNFSLTTGITYNANEKSERYFFGASYGRYFPIINASIFKNNFRELDFKYEVEETGLKGGISIPLNLTSGIFQRELVFSTNYTFSYLNNRKINLKAADRKNGSISDTSVVVEANGIVDPMRDTYFQSLDGQIIFSNARRKAIQNIYPHLGHYIDIQYKRSINLPQASQLSLIYELAFPGFFINHNFVLEGGWQHDSYHPAYRYLNNFYYPKGHSPRQIFGGNLARVGINYHFPIAYPDWGFAGLLYFLRIRGNIFYDFGVQQQDQYQAIFRADPIRDYALYQNNTTTYLETLGAELILDMKIFSILNLPIFLRYNINIANSPLFSPFEIGIPIKRL